MTYGGLSGGTTGIGSSTGYTGSGFGSSGYGGYGSYGTSGSWDPSGYGLPKIIEPINAFRPIDKYVIAKQGLTSTSALGQKITYIVSLRQDPIFNRVFALRSKIDSSSLSYKFSYVFFNQKLNTLIPPRPLFIQLDVWKKILKSNPDPDHLVPVALCGFSALEDRMKAQKEIVSQIEERVKILQKKLREMKTFSQTEVSSSLQRIKQNAITIDQLLLFSEDEGELTNEERKMIQSLEDLRVEISKPDSFFSAINNIRGLAMKRSGTPMNVDQGVMAQLHKIISANQDAIEGLQKVTKTIKKQARAFENLVHSPSSGYQRPLLPNFRSYQSSIFHN